MVQAVQGNVQLPDDGHLARRASSGASRARNTGVFPTGSLTRNNQIAAESVVIKAPSCPTTGLSGLNVSLLSAEAAPPLVRHAPFRQGGRLACPK